LSNVEDWNDKEDIFYYVQCHVNFRGKLEVLKWLDMKGFDFDKSVCAIDAAHFGNLHIIQWLREVKGLELDGELYCCAIEGGQLRVLKWLRERKVPWTERTFKCAVKEGNLDILQWLHNEGCPWPDNIWYRVHEDEIEPESLAWLRANGYGDKYAHKQESPTATSLSA